VNLEAQWSVQDGLVGFSLNNQLYFYRVCPTSRNISPTSPEDGPTWLQPGPNMAATLPQYGPSWIHNYTTTTQQPQQPEPEPVPQPESQRVPQPVPQLVAGCQA